MKKFKEFLEYVSEALALTSIVIYVSTRHTLNNPFSFFDLAYIIMALAFLWSRGYAEHLEHVLERLLKKINHV